MASGSREWSCPICCEVPGDIAHALPCRHEFCLGCILRWLRGKRTCPLCRALISAVSFSKQEEDCLQCIIKHPREAASPAGNAAGSSDGSGAYGFVTCLAPAEQGTLSPAEQGTLSPAEQGTLSPAEQGAAGPEAVGGILPELWAELFRRRQELLNPVRSWLQPWLQEMYEGRWWQAKTAESGILLALCTFGPDREELAQRLRPRLRHRTAPLVDGVLGLIGTLCRREVQRLRGCPAAREAAERPGASSGPSASPGDVPASGEPPDSSGEHEAGTLEEALERSLSPCRSINAEPEQP